VSDSARPRPSARRRAPATDDGGPAGSRSTALAEPLEARPEEEPADDDDADLGHPGAEDPDDDGAATARRGRRVSVPLVPALAVLLVLLLGLVAYLAAPRLFAEESSVRTGTYVEVLQAARANVVDLTSFDYLTIDDDIEQARRVTTGDFTDDAVALLEDVRPTLVEGQAVYRTEVVGAGVSRAGEDEATVVMVISATREAANEATAVSRTRIEVSLQREGDRWLLSGITEL
jgi:Mce-associated membrane protein